MNTKEFKSSNVSIASFKEYNDGCRAFKFDHIVIRSNNSDDIVPDYNALEASNILDITYVTSYPEGCIVLIDAANGLNTEFYWFLTYRIHELLDIVNSQITTFSNIEDSAAYRDLITAISFFNKHSRKFEESKGFYMILTRIRDDNGNKGKFETSFTSNTFIMPSVLKDIKPIPFKDNFRYMDSDDTALDSLLGMRRINNAFTGAFVPDCNNLKDIARKYNNAEITPVEFNPSELYPTSTKIYPTHKTDIDSIKAELQTVADEFITEQEETAAIERNVDKMALQMSRDTEILTQLKQLVVMNPKRIVDIYRFIEGHTVDNVEENLEFLVDFVNVYVEHGRTLEYAWTTEYGQLLRDYITAILDSDDDRVKNVSFAIYVDDDNRLIFARYNDINEKVESFNKQLSEEGQYIRFAGSEAKRIYDKDMLIGLVNKFNDQVHDNITTEQVWNEPAGLTLNAYINKLIKEGSLYFKIEVNALGHLDLDFNKDSTAKENAANNEALSEPGGIKRIKKSNTNSKVSSISANVIQYKLAKKVGSFNKLIRNGIDIKDAWQEPAGKDLAAFIEQIFNTATNVNANINFAIVVNDDKTLSICDGESVNEQLDPQRRHLTRLGDNLIVDPDDEDINIHETIASNKSDDK